MNASILTMLTAISPFLIAGFSVCILKTKLNLNYYVSLVFVLVGVIITAVAGLWGGQTTVIHTTLDQVVGIIFQLICITLNSLQAVIEEMILQKFFLIPA